MDLHLTPLRFALAIVILLGAVLAGQAAADAMAPGVGTVSTGESLGRASFAYLTGLRVFAAQVLWNRIEPLFHEYYDGVPLNEQAYMLPTMNMVIMLDPQFDQPYYVAAWIIAQRGDVEGGVELARRGVENNPVSGLLKSNYVQLLIVSGEGDLQGEDRATALRMADEGVGDETVWTDDAEKFEGYAIFAAAYKLAGEPNKEAAARAEMEEIEHGLEGGAIGGEGHDHDGDGVPDH